MSCESSVQHIRTADDLLGTIFLPLEGGNWLRELSLKIHAVTRPEALLLQALHCGEAIREVDEAVQHPIQRIKHLIVGLAISCSEPIVRCPIGNVGHAGHQRSRWYKRRIVWKNCASRITSYDG